MWEPHSAMVLAWIFAALVILVALLLLRYGIKSGGERKNRSP